MVTERVLVMEQVPGLRYTDASSQLDDTVDTEQLLQLAGSVFRHRLIIPANATQVPRRP